MGKISKLFFASAALLCATAIAFAQSSDTSVGTSGVFKTGTDNFNSVADFGKIGTSHVFFGLTSGRLEGGAGARLSENFYLAGYFYGNGFQRVNSVSSLGNDSVQLQTAYLLNNGTIVGKTVTTTTKGKAVTTSANAADVLVGASDVGIKFGLSQNEIRTVDKWNVDNIVLNVTNTTWTTLIPFLVGGQGDSLVETYAADGTTVVGRTSTVYTKGLSLDIPTTSFTPEAAAYLQFGTRLPIGSLVVVPRLTAYLNFLQTALSQSYVMYNQNIGSGYPTYPATNGITEAQSYTAVDYAQAQKNTTLSLAADATLEMPSAEGTSSEVQIAYGFASPFYKNAYTDNAGVAKSVAGKAYSYHSLAYAYNSGGAMGTTVTDLKAFQADGYSLASHTLYAYYKYVASLGEKLSAGLKFSANMSFSQSKTTSTGALTQVTTFTSSIASADNTVDTIEKSYTGSSTVTNSFSLTPGVYAGLQFAIIPDALILNVGGTASLPNIVKSDTTTTQPGIATFKETKTSGSGNVLTNSYTSSLGNTRTETQTAYTDVSFMSTSVRAGLTLVLAEGVVLDTIMSSTATTITPTFSLQLSVSK